MYEGRRNKEGAIFFKVCPNAAKVYYTAQKKEVIKKFLITTKRSHKDENRRNEHLSDVQPFLFEAEAFLSIRFALNHTFTSCLFYL